MRMRRSDSRALSATAALVVLLTLWVGLCMLGGCATVRVSGHIASPLPGLGPCGATLAVDDIDEAPNGCPA